MSGNGFERRAFGRLRLAANGDRSPYSASGDEPNLDDLMTDPTTKLVMASDRVRYRDLRNLITTARHNLRSRPPAWRV